MFSFLSNISRLIKLTFILIYMLASILEGYLLMIFVLLHLSILFCDDACFYPLRYVKFFASRDFLQLIGNFASIFHISKGALQILGQFLLIGDFFVITILTLKMIGCFVRRFTFVFISLAISAFLLRKLEVI